MVTGHTHDGQGDHPHEHAEEDDHHHFEDTVDLVESGEIDPSATVAPNPSWIILNSVGIDIGSSTSHLTFSKLFLERKGMELSSRFVVVRRDVLYRSPILLTPYRDIETIDVDRISAFILHHYGEAGLQPSQVHTGAVICTGEAVKKKNAEAITRMLASMGGKFVCATAGPRLEGILASHGSGAVARSSDGSTILNVDVGGGTCKATLVRNGTVLDTGAINVGSRLIAWDAQGRIDRIEKTGRKIAESVGIVPQLGETMSEADKRRFAQTLADLLFEYLQRGALSPLAQELLATGPLTYEGQVDAVVFSGGVGEYIYGHDTRDYGDLGPIFAEEILTRFPALNAPRLDSVERIRATVIGASQYTIQVSSSTIFLSDKSVLPLRDHQVVVPQLAEENLTEQSVAASIQQAMERFDLFDADTQRPVALYIRWPFEISYDSLRTLALGIVAALSSIDEVHPWVLVFDADIGGLVGSLLKDDLGVRPAVVAIDEIDLRDLDYVDIGQEILNRQAVPVVVKSLVFE